MQEPAFAGAHEADAATVVATESWNGMCRDMCRGVRGRLPLQQGMRCRTWAHSCKRRTVRHMSPHHDDGASSQNGAACRVSLYPRNRRRVCPAVMRQQEGNKAPEFPQIIEWLLTSPHGASKKVRRPLACCSCAGMQHGAFPSRRPVSPWLQG